MLTAIRYPSSMRTLFLLLVLVMPTAVFAHGGIPKVRTAPELSDIALFAFACLGVWLVRRAMRARFAKSRED